MAILSEKGVLPIPTSRLRRSRGADATKAQTNTLWHCFVRASFLRLRNCHEIDVRITLVGAFWQKVGKMRFLCSPSLITGAEIYN